MPGSPADSPCSGTLELVDELTEELIIASGGWHPRYARVLLIQQIGDQAIVLVDGNGDGAEVESERWSRTSQGWVGGSSSGIGPFGQRPLWTWGWAGSTAFAVGCAAPGMTVTVEWRDQVREATANERGIWVSLFPGLPQPPRDWPPPVMPDGFYDGDSGSAAYQSRLIISMAGSGRPADQPRVR